MDNMTWVQSGLRTVANVPEAGAILMLKNHSALDEIMLGHGNRDHVDVLIAATNIAEALAQDKALGADWQEEIRVGQDAILSMAKRSLKSNVFVFTLPELHAVRVVLELHDEQLKSCTVKRMEEALDMVTSVLRHKKARTIVEQTETA